ncbi:phosphoribosyltransferase family protein [Desulfurococcus mucosus]|uniref:phosphoribosyltransferase family protein n=1 Tax=Desulfurococcus mucosus TaxID=2275 RepID=UPI00064E1EB2|nr:phosphoribosyltransferase family protein [Desulfurococcus mucosus]
MFRVRGGRVLVVKKPSEAEVKAFAQRLMETHSRSKADRTKMRLMASEILRLLKPSLSYRDLYEITGIPESVLCRYARGSIIPSFEQAAQILSRIALSIDLSYLLRDLVEKEKSPIIDLLRVLKDPYVARLLSIILVLELTGKEVSKIIATAEAVLPLATMLSLEFNAPIILVKRKSYPGVQYYSTSFMKSPKDVETLYLDRDLLSRRDKVLVLSDVVYSGRTLEAVLELLSKSRAEITDIIVVLGLGDMWRERLEEYNVKVLTVIPFTI